MTWRAIWLRAQLTGIAVSCLVWLVLSPLAPSLVALGWLAGTVVVAAWPTRLALRLRYGGRPVTAKDREGVLRAVAPIQAMRGRREPEVWVNRRRSVGLIAGQHELVVSEKMLDGLRTRRLSDLHFATLTARAVGVAAVNRSRLVAAVELFCLPWSLVQRIGRHLQPKAPRRFFTSHIQRCVAGLVLIVAAIDLYQRALWVSLVMVGLVGVAAVRRDPSTAPGPSGSHRWPMPKCAAAVSPRRSQQNPIRGRSCTTSVNAITAGRCGREHHVRRAPVLGQGSVSPRGCGRTSGSGLRRTLRASRQSVDPAV